MCKEHTEYGASTAYIKRLGRAGRKPCFDDMMPTMF